MMPGAIIFWCLGPPPTPDFARRSGLLTGLLREKGNFQIILIFPIQLRLLRLAGILGVIEKKLENIATRAKTVHGLLYTKFGILPVRDFPFSEVLKISRPNSDHSPRSINELLPSQEKTPLLVFARINT